MFYPTFLMQVLTFALFACAFNMVIGNTGLLSFGHAAFFGSAAYTTAHAMKHWFVTPEIALLLGLVVAAVLGLLFGLLAIRRQGIYFAMITLALAQIIYFIALRSPFTGGEDGIQRVPRGELFGLIPLDSNYVMYFFVLTVFILGFLLIRRITHSPFGQVLGAIRENEARAISLGYEVNRYKLLAFIMSAGLAGLAGGLAALVFRLASLNGVQWHMSGEVVLMTLLGGIGTLFGPIVGATVIVSLEYFMAESTVPVPVVKGVIFVACVLMFRRGIVGEFSHMLSVHRQKKQAAPVKPVELGVVAANKGESA